jgi:LPS export ABC transporter protein LptC
MIGTMRAMILTALAALGAAACGGTTAPPFGDYDTLPADNVMIDVEHAMTRNGVRQSVLKSDTTLAFNDSSTFHLRGVNLKMYTEEGAVRATLTSQTGELDQTTNRMVARGNVVLVVHGPNGRTIWSEELHYDPQQGRLWSNVRTRTRTDRGEELIGDGFTADDQFSNVSVTQPQGTGLRIEF